MRSRFLLLLLLAALLAPTLHALPVTAGTTAEEYQLKAAFLYNFMLLSERSGISADDGKLCILGQDPFGVELDRYDGRESQGGNISIRRIETVKAARECRVLFIAASEHGRVEQIRSLLGEKSPLTVAEANGFNRRSVMIVLVSSGNRVGFEVNLTAARQAGLSLNPKLLRLAKEVY